MVGVCELKSAGVYGMLPVGVEGAGELLPNAAGGSGAGEELSMDAIDELRGGGVVAGAAREDLGVAVGLSGAATAAFGFLPRPFFLAGALAGVFGSDLVDGVVMMGPSCAVGEGGWALANGFVADVVGVDGV